MSTHLCRTNGASTDSRPARCSEARGRTSQDQSTWRQGLLLHDVGTCIRHHHSLIRVLPTARNLPCALLRRALTHQPLLPVPPKAGCRLQPSRQRQTHASSNASYWSQHLSPLASSARGNSVVTRRATLELRGSFSALSSYSMSFQLRANIRCVPRPVVWNSGPKLVLYAKSVKLSCGRINL